ncbi:hypothetical protein F2Q70_00026187 [Brassica cretica]|uniref:Uncharacterized protein n=1 Tax=Brassica cretica TaxID=69181 RepID=A0A8S9LI18_BRACR|nr:hypothetical protein F2Q70_00026187 [Brassica cretica]
MVSPDYLTTLKDFYQIPSGVVFWIPSGNESAKNPPEGFFTCYEAFLVYCRMWFPIPGTIVRALCHFGLSISQLSIPALQHWLGVLISSYELGMDLNPGDFEGFWFTRGTAIDGSYRMAPKKGMAIIQGHTSHPKAWFERLFFVRIDGESVEESYLHLFRREWNFTRGSFRRLLPIFLLSEIFFAAGLSSGIPSPSNGFENRPLVSCPLRGRESGLGKARELPPRTSWETFRCQNGTLVSPQGKGVEPARFPFPATFLSTSLAGFTTHKSLDEESRRKVVGEGSSLINEGMRVFNAALDESFRESRISHFKAEEAERELFRFRKEVEEQIWRQAELHSRALVRAERRGKGAIVAEMKRRAALFATEFESFKDAQEFVGDFCECRGSVTHRRVLLIGGKPS